MRRGHPGIGGWRNDNPRHYRPRSGGTPHFRPPRGYGHADAPRFQAPGSRPMLGPVPYSPNVPANDHDRHSYRGGRNPRRPHDRGQYQHQSNRQIFPFLQRMRQGDVPDHSNYQDTPNYYGKNQKPWETMNSMGDIDHRNPGSVPINRPSPWANKYVSDDRTPTKSYRHQDNEHNTIPQSDYTGHRPPASDHYGSNHGSTMDNSNTFSRSIDDTVDIVRKRLQNRDSQPPSECPSESQNDADKNPEPIDSDYSNVQQNQHTKKKSRKIKNIKSNCDQIKTKIVQQLFMMDKDRIHKLMDNPNSSSKFEYAISSLVTESQNSFNRHLRSVAEKSLCGPSTSEFIHDDNNTIYEDTFMKQMQGILDPQDTILLEDIKPIVLAELSKVLQIDDLQLRQDIEESSYSRNDQPQYDYTQDSYEDYNRFEPYSAVDQPADYYDQKQSPCFESSQSPKYGNRNNDGFSNSQKDYDCGEPLFERRKSSKSGSRSHSRRSSEERKKERRSADGRKSIDEENFRRNNPRPLFELNPDDATSGTPVPLFEPNPDDARPHFGPNPENSKQSETPRPLFDCNVEQLSDEEDPFAELDRQYHVAVDHNFIENEYMSSPQPPHRSRPQTPAVKREAPTHSQGPTPEKPKHNKPQVPLVIKTPERPPALVKQEIDHQLQDMAKSPLEFLSPKSTAGSETPIKKPEILIKQELIGKPTPTKQRKSVEDNAASVPSNNEQPPEPQGANTTPVKSEHSNSSHDKSSTPTDSRKRSTDLKPSHRKEKRKKSECAQPDSSNKQILNKNIIIHVSDCAKTSDKSVYNLYFSKENSTKDSSKDSKKVDSSDKKYSDKYVKRKERESGSKKSKDKDSDGRKKHDSSSSSHSTVNTSDVSNTSISQTPSKADIQTKLKPIDMFGDQMKKPGAHSAHRNTSAPPAAPVKTPVELKPVVISRKVTKRHIGTQVSRKCLSQESQTTESKSSSSRFCQTDRKKIMTRGAQTEPVSFKAVSKSKDPLERMKEIDMEIQALLQEKFKLYNSLENKESGTNTMQSLGMAVLNVAPPDLHETESSISEDMIVDDFTSIPVEELEQIALESVQEEQNQAAAEKRSRRKKAQETKRKRTDSSQSSTPSQSSSRSKRAAKTSYLSLIEQIIDDERPLEEIISLDEDDFEVPITKKAHKKQTKPKKTNSKKKVTNVDYNAKYDIKPCSVSLKRDDLKKLLHKLKNASNVKSVLHPVKQETKATFEEETAVSPANDTQVESKSEITPVKSDASETSQTCELVEQVINDIQFDMLDVSEDIVIGEEVSLKSEEKESGDRSTPAVCEEIILDNSQSSAEAAATDGGGECKMYDYSADENLRRDSVTISGNGDAVLAIECIDNNFIAACLDGNVYHFSGEGKLLNTLRGSNLAVTCLTIVKEKYGTTVYTGSLDSRIRYYDLDTGMEKGPECNVLSPIQTMDRAWDTVFVGTRTGFVLQFECKNNMLIPVSTVKFSDQSILALRAMKEGPRKVLLVAARSEPVTIKDAQTGLLLRTLEGPKMTVYTLLFEDGKVYCGTSSHQIHVFDYSSGSHIGSHEGGKGAVCLRATGGLVFAGCYDGCVYVYREGEPAPRAQLRGPGNMLLSLAVLGSKIIAGYKDRSLYIWKIPLAIMQEMIL
ncbi:hypothetical protein O0L34_g10955 [Tuta absoluta]|nr:hypothetical protein O0L34_g10955 [Tuta absoluta]